MSIMQIQIYLSSGVGVCLSIKGNLNIYDNANTLESDKIPLADHLRGIGAVIFFLIYIQYTPFG